MYCKEGYVLRIIEKADLEWVRLMHNSPDVLYMLTDTTMINSNQQQKWFDFLTSSNKSDRLIIEFNEDKIGIVRIDDLDFRNRSVCIGLDIEKKYQHKGHGRNCLNILLKYCFEELNMNRVWLLVASFNVNAIELYKKTGLIVEGKQRERLYRNGNYHDYLMMSILRAEYLKRNYEE